MGGRRVGVHGRHVISQIAVEGRTVLRIVSDLFEQRHSDAHYHCPLDLVAAGKRMVLAFFSELCIERNLKSGKPSSTGKIAGIMKILRGL